MTATVPRVVEAHAATHGDRLAIMAGGRNVDYRQLNMGANAVARSLMAQGFRRGSHACVRMPRSTDLAVVLLAILKAGGSYTWIDPEQSVAACPEGVSIVVPGIGTGNGFQFVDLASVLGHDVPASPNLPIVTRPGDIACVVEKVGVSVTKIPHETITGLGNRTAASWTSWTGEAGALDLWAALMTGATAVIEEPVLHVAAA